MKRLIAISLVLLSVSAGRAEPIPLDQIWGYHLPGTRDIAGIPLPETDPQQGVIGRTYEQFRRQREFNIEQMRQALTAKRPTERALPGFVVPRHPDFFTLQRASTFAAAMMRHGQERRGASSDTYQVGEEMTLVFFSHPASYYARLKEVERKGKEITVRYQFEPHSSVESTVHFALIPLGKLSAGEYRVTYKQVPMDEKYREAGFEIVPSEAFTLISRPFSFTMWESPTIVDEPLAKDATLIPLDQIWGHHLPRTKDIRELDPLPNVRDPAFEEAYSRSTIINIAKYLSSYTPKQDEKAGPAFVVIGTGKEALKNAYAVFREDAKQPETWMPRDTDLSLVFYSYAAGWPPQIKSVVKSPGHITVKYQFVTPSDRINGSKRLAIIPLGKLPEGRVQVDIEQIPPVDFEVESVVRRINAERLVSGSFSFDVR